MQFPPIKLCYENMIHNKVFNQHYDIMMAIPVGKKCFLWITHDQCRLLETYTFEIFQQFSCSNFNYKKNSIGTIFYGTIFTIHMIIYFCIENIYYHNRKIKSKEES
jgi:hypothetical protein